MKTITRIAVLASLFLFVFTANAQFTSSSSKGSDKGKNQNRNGHSRQQDIYLLEQRAKTIEQDVLNKNTEVFDTHKAEVLAIMDREIVRSTNDLAQLKYKLKKMDGGPQSQEGRALQIEINQMEGRVGRQKLVRSNVSALTREKVTVDNAKELAGLKTQYFQFIDTMKANMKYSGGSGSPSGNTGGHTSGSHGTSTGTASNVMYSSSSSSAEKKKEELPDSYYRMKDKKSGENYLNTKKNTALALTSSAQELQTAMNQSKTTEVVKMQQDILERMETDIAMDSKMANQIDAGELKYSGLNSGMIKNNATKKKSVLNKAKSLKLPAQKGQFFSLVNQYIQLLK